MELPIEYRWLSAHNFKGFLPWWFIDKPGQEELRVEYQKETGEDFYPFTRRQDCDDVAGFKVIGGDIQKSIVSVHLTWSGKLDAPTKTQYKDIFSWLTEEVIPLTLEWVSEDDLAELEVENV